MKSLVLIILGKIFCSDILINGGADEFRKRLLAAGFEDAILALRDPGEILNMRKVDNKIFQYHVRLFNDNEVRVHYEFSGEARPIRHCWGTNFEFKKEAFTKILNGWILP